jgi:two-component system cell cycle sensor histidine kinase/response regulator CckA
LRGLDYLADDLYRRWVRVAITIALVAYALVTILDVVLYGPGGRPAAILSQSLTVLACAVALGLAWRGRSGLAALLTLAAIWVELQWEIPLTGVRTSGLIAFPVLVTAAGILLGIRAGYIFAALNTLSLAGLSIAGIALNPGQVAAPADAAYLVVVTSASMFGAAALVQLGLDSLAKVLVAARASEQRLKGLLRYAPDGVVAADAGGRILALNPAAEAIVGRTEESLVGQDLASVMGEACLGAAADWAPEALRAQGPDQEVRPLRLLSPEGSLKWVDCTVGVVPWDDGSTGFQLILRDVTERRQSEEAQQLLRSQLEHAQRLEAVGRLAGGVAHEFNNILTIVGGAAELLTSESDDEVQELAQEIVAAKSRGASLTKQLLSFARKDLIQPRRMCLAETVRGMEALLRRFLTERVRFTLDVAADPPPIVADRAQVEQVIVNLVLNAKDAIQGDGSVTLGVASAGTRRRGRDGTEWTVEPATVELWVEDDGRGMDGETRARIFEPFFTTKPRGAGTGLGLATVHGIVIQNGGRIRVLSRPGVGTAIVVSWPTVPVDAA